MRPSQPPFFAPSLRRSLRLTGASLVRLVHTGGPTHAAAVSFYAIFSIFPLLLLLIGVLGFFAEPEATQRKVLDLAGQYFPAGSHTFLRENIRSIVEARGPLSFLSLAGLLWSATLMFDAIIEAVNAAWGTRQNVRYLTAKLISILIVILALMFVLLSTLLTTQIALVARFPVSPPGLHPPVWLLGLGSFMGSAFSAAISLALTWSAFSLSYRLLPKTAVRFADVWRPALFAALLWSASMRVFVWYVTGFADYGHVYGPLSAIFVLLLWIYISALIHLWGACLCHAYAHRGEEAVPQM